MDASSQAGASEVVTFLSSPLFIVYLQKFLKTTDAYGAFVKAVPGADKWAHRIVAGLGALIVGVGIHVTFDGDAMTGWTFHGTIPNLWTLLHGFYDVVRVFALQQWFYDASKQPPYVNPVLTTPIAPHTGGK